MTEEAPNKMTREEYERLKQRQKEVQNEGVKEISVSIDPKTISDAENWQKFLNQAKERILKKSVELGVEWDLSDIKSLEDVTLALDSLKEIELARKPAPKGQASLEGQYSSGKREYSDIKEMVEDLYRREHSEDENVAKEAKAIIEEFYRKMARGIEKGAKMDSEIELEGSVKEALRPHRAKQAKRKLEEY